MNKFPRIVKNPLLDHLLNVVRESFPVSDKDYSRRPVSEREKCEIYQPTSDGRKVAIAEYENI